MMLRIVKQQNIRPYSNNFLLAKSKTNTNTKKDPMRSILSFSTKPDKQIGPVKNINNNSSLCYRCYLQGSQCLGLRRTCLFQEQFGQIQKKTAFPTVKFIGGAIVNVLICVLMGVVSMVVGFMIFVCISLGDYS